MNPTKHSSNNMVLAAPKGSENDIQPLPLTRTSLNGIPSNVSFWQPSEEEIAGILAGMPIVLHVLGPAIYPAYIGVADTL